MVKLPSSSTNQEYLDDWRQTTIGMFLLLICNTLVVIGVIFNYHFLLLPWLVIYIIGKPHFKCRLSLFCLFRHHLHGSSVHHETFQQPYIYVFLPDNCLHDFHHSLGSYQPPEGQYQGFSKRREF